MESFNGRVSRRKRLNQCHDQLFPGVALAGNSLQQADRVISQEFVFQSSVGEFHHPGNQALDIDSGLNRREILDTLLICLEFSKLRVRKMSLDPHRSQN